MSFQSLNSYSNQINIEKQASLNLTGLNSIDAQSSLIIDVLTGIKVNNTQLKLTAGQVNVAGGVLGYLKINILGVTYAIPYYGLAVA